MKLRYTPEAWRDLQDMRDYISGTLSNPQAAERIVKSIHAACQMLKEQPNMGRSVGIEPVHQVEMRFIVCEKHLAFYMMEGEIISVVRILNARQDYLRIILAAAEMR